MTLLLPILAALVAWWFATGVVLYLDGLPRRTFPWTFGASTLLCAGGIVLAGSVRHDPGTAAAYLSFLGGFLAWGWQEVSFYTGYVTGPRKRGCAPGCRGWRHFGHALQVSLWHELAIVASALVLWAAVAPGENRVGFWAFVILWALHESARINVFLGVRNVSEGFLPDHLRYLSSFLTRRRMNPLLPISLGASAVLAWFLLGAALEAGGTGSGTGLALLAGLALLGVVEHLFLVLPIPLDRIWDWSLRSRRREGAGSPPPLERRGIPTPAPPPPVRAR